MLTYARSKPCLFGRIFGFALFFLASGLTASAATTGATFCGTAANNTGVGTEDWANLGNACADGDGNAYTGEFTGESYYLYVDTFGFSIPEGATIDGITVTAETDSNSGTCVDGTVKIFNEEGSPEGDDKATTGTWNGSTRTWGGASDDWNGTFSAADLNDADFGVGISTDATTGNCWIDWVKIDVSYTEVSAVCGDGSVEGLEECDDGDIDDGDGCSSACAVEEGWSCEGEPSVCGAAECGDGLIIDDEECDDGDIDNGDGCSSSCAVEEGWTCEGEPSSCVEWTPWEVSEPMNWTDLIAYGVVVSSFILFGVTGLWTYRRK